MLKSRFSSLCVSRPPPLLLALHLIALERSSSQHFEGLLLRSAPPIGSYSLLLGDPLVQGKDRRLSRPGTGRAVSTPSSPFTSPRQRVVCVYVIIYIIYIYKCSQSRRTNFFFFFGGWPDASLSLSPTRLVLILIYASYLVVASDFPRTSASAQSFSRVSCVFSSVLYISANTTRVLVILHQHPATYRPATRDGPKGRIWPVKRAFNLFILFFSPPQTLAARFVF